MYERMKKKINMKKSLSMNVCTYISFRWHRLRPNGITSCLKKDKSNKKFLRLKIDLMSFIIERKIFFFSIVIVDKFWVA